MLSTALILACESAINKVLSSDNTTCAALEKISGSIYEFNVLDAPIHFFLIPLQSGISIQSDFSGSPDTCFSGSLNSFCQLAGSEDSAEQLFGNGVNISGDHRLATKLQQIISTVDIDWQGIIASHSSDLFASQLAKVFTKTQHQLSNIANSLELNISEYLTEEAQYLPCKPEIDFFLEECARLQQQTERLEARLELLTKA